MSVINKVLKDLETRESRFTPIEIKSIESVPAAPSRPARPMLYAGLLVLLLAGAAAIYHYRHLLVAPEPSGLATAAVLPAITVVEAEASPVAVAEPPALTDAIPANQIIGLQIRETETEMRLEFALRERVVAYLKERGENNFAYHLRDTGSEIVAPLMRDNPWIRALSIEESASGVDIHFATAAGILVETRQQRSETGSMWMIDLRQARPASVAKSSASENVPGAKARPDVASEVPPDELPASLQKPAPASEETAPVAAVKVEIKASNAATVSANQLQYAVELMNSGRSEDAENLLLGLLGGNDDYRARQHLMAFYSRHKRPGKLRSLLLASLAEYPRDPLFISEYARLLFQAGGYREVIELLAQGDALDARQSALLAASYQRLDEHEAAVLYYRQSLQQDAGDARNWVGLGISQEQMAAFADALDSYQRASGLGKLNARLQAFVERRSENLRRVVN